ncbi:MAG: hypothetical protein KGI29_04465 [Pseudomonadota bacterium]|nr:hypothetical protein [Pseudomonadota bacterium]MDE3036851.1 hypothetical protein [Pseudomonadota bacterium]
MLKLVIFHLLLLLMLPILWHFWQKSEAESAARATAARGTLSEAEQAYYDTIFSYVMETVRKNGSYSWQDGDASGSFTVGGPFVSASRALCRRYAESYNIRGASGTTRGYGCKRSGDGNAGWCRLPEGSGALTCALEPPDNSFDSVIRSGSDFLSTIVSGVQNLR